MGKRQYISVNLLIVLVWVLLPGCGDKIPQGKFTPEQMETIPLTNRYLLPEATGGMVFSIDKETITADEVIVPMQKNLTELARRMGEEEFIAQTLPAMRKLIRDRAADLLLYKEARKNAPNEIDELLEKAVEKEVSRFVAGCGNDFAEAQRQLKAMGMDWRSFRDFQRKLILTQSYMSSNLFEEKSFSHTELLDLYNEVKDEYFYKPAIIEFRLIDLQADKLRDDQVDAGETREAAMRRVGAELLALLQLGEDFETLAKEYSHGPLAAMGGLWRPVTVGTDSLPEPYNLIEEKVKDANRGDLVGPIEAPGHLFLVRVENCQREQLQRFEEVQSLLEMELKRRHQREQQNKMLDKLIHRADLIELERFAEFCVKEAYRRWGKA